MDFVHLHNHTEYSLADATSKVKKIPKRVKELGMKAFAITDHGVMYGVIDFYKACKDEGIKPIIGMEAYVAPRKNTLKEANIDNANYHLVLLCENNQGYDNLIQIASDAALNGFYYKPRTDKTMLKKYHENIIALSACLGGEVQEFLLKGKYDEAKKAALEYNDIFGQGNFYLELQDHKMPEQAIVNTQLIRMHRETGIPLVCTNDCHYITRDGYKPHDVLMAIQAKTTVDDTKRKKYPSDEFYIKSPSEMYSIFGYIPEAIENTNKIAERCNVEFEFGVNKLPPFNVPKSFNGTNLEFLSFLCYDGARRLYGEVTPEIKERIEYEMQVVSNMGYINYFLIVWDFFRFCREGTEDWDDDPRYDWEPILTGPGRGSGAGSIILFTLGVTKIDPIKYDLLFERFLDPSRISMPDVDSDFAYDRRQEVVDYVVRKYGRNSVSQIITFGTMAARAVLRQVGKATNLPLLYYDKLCKMVPQEPDMTLKKAMSMNPDLKVIYDTDDNAKTLIDMSMELEGLPIYTGTHAAGVLITDPKGVTAYVPVWNNDGAIVSQFPMGTLEELGLLKMDFLGLRTLTVVNDAIAAIERNHGVKVSLDDIYFGEDKAPLKLIQDGFTMGIFQLEGAGMTTFMKELKGKTWEEIMDGISLYRPGPMQYIPKYLENRRNRDNIHYDFPELKPILSGTYGILTYQEQVMRAVIAVAGYAKSDSDGFRKVISKKKKDQLPLHRKWFIDGRGETDDDGHGHIKKYTPIPGGVALGHQRELLDKFFDEMQDFASYCFNKSHAAAYMVVAKVTAWLMFYYPTEFMAALLTSVKSNLKKVNVYIKGCRDMGIEILPPDINTGNDSFVALPGKKIVYTLSAKNTNADALEGIVAVRKEHYKNFEDFLKKNAYTINKPTIEALASIGALDSLGVVRSQIIAGVEDIADAIRKAKDKIKRNISAWERYYTWTNSSCLNCEHHNVKNKEYREEKCAQCQYTYVPRSRKPAEEEPEINIDLTNTIPDIAEYPKETLLALEKKYLGIYLSGHPLYKYAFAMKNMGDFKSTDMDYEVDEETGQIIVTTPIQNGQKVKMIAMLNSIRQVVTRTKGEQMAFVELEDLYGNCSMVIFPREYTKIKGILKEGETYAIYGSIQISDENAPSIVCEDMKPVKEQLIDRVVVSVNSLLEANQLITDIVENKFLQGFNPIYIEYQNIRAALNSKNWVNIDEVPQALSKYNYKIMNW